MQQTADLLCAWFHGRKLCDFQSKFSYLLTRETLSSIKDSYDGFSLFIKGLNCEYIDRDYLQALSYYEEGASQFNSQCLYRLFHIYLGERNFQTEYSEVKCITYLVFSGILEGFDYKLGAWDILHQFKTTKDPQLKKMIKILEAPISPYEFIPNCVQLMIVFLRFLFGQDVFDQIGVLVNDLTERERRMASFSIVGHLTDIMTTKLQYIPNNESVQKFVQGLLFLHSDHLAFDGLHKHFSMMLKLSGLSKDHGTLFCHRIENMVWVWVFSFYSITKNVYLGDLTPFIENFTCGNLALRWGSTLSWVRSYKAYHLEKGLGCKKDLEKALDEYMVEIEVNSTALYARVRRLITLKELGRMEQVESFKEEYMRVFDERMGQKDKVNCYLSYVMGKYYEKITEDEEKALEWYEKGVTAENGCHKIQWFGNESWRVYCERKRDKLRCKRNGEGNSFHLKYLED